MFQLRGGAALSEFRLQKLLSSAQALVPELVAVHTGFVHFVDLHSALDAQKQSVLERLLRYGEARPAEAIPVTLLTVPRPGTISP